MSERKILQFRQPYVQKHSEEYPPTHDIECESQLYESGEDMLLYTLHHPANIKPYYTDPHFPWDGLKTDFFGRDKQLILEARNPDFTPDFLLRIEEIDIDILYLETTDKHVIDRQRRDRWKRRYSSSVFVVEAERNLSHAEEAEEHIINADPNKYREELFDQYLQSAILHCGCGAHITHELKLYFSRDSFDFARHFLDKRTYDIGRIMLEDTR